jgi:outer membrane protein assembly factor BamB
MLARTILLLSGIHRVGTCLAAAPDADATPALSPATLVGTWSGELIHQLRRTAVALHVSEGKDGKFDLALSVPVVHLARVPLGSANASFDGNHVTLGAFELHYEPATKALSGNLPKALVPVHTLRLALAKRDQFAMPARADLAAPKVEPPWQYDAQSPLWAGPRVHDGTAYVGAQDGTLHAIDTHTQQARWVFQTGGALRVRPSIDAGTVYAQSDDGFLYAVDADSGKQRWRVQVNAAPVTRLPFDHPKSLFDRFGSDVLIAGQRLYLGTHEGRVLALDAGDGHTLWTYATGDAVLAAPMLHQGRLFVGSFDHHVYAIDAADGSLIWKHDAQEAMVSTPAWAEGKIVIGTRGYDLIALDAATGKPAWTQYLWFSWVESNAVVRDGVAYVGSSDAAAAYAIDVRDGARRWASDVQGWAWGQPVVTDTHVYVGTSSQIGYLAQHRGAMLALDRATGRVLWQYPVTAPKEGAYGFAGSADVDDTYVYASALDGKLYAFRR